MRSRFPSKRGLARAGSLGLSPAGGGDWLRRRRFLDAPPVGGAARGAEAADSMAMGARGRREGGRLARVLGFAGACRLDASVYLNLRSANLQARTHV
jgi:hypothetical protein